MGLANIEPGGGKTPLGTFAAQESGADVTLIIAPDQTHRSAWQPTTEEILGEPARILGNQNKANKQALSDFELGYPGTYLASPQFFTRTDVQGWSGDMLIVDEGHLLNSAKTKGQRKLSGYVPADGQPISRRFGGRLFLSGTAWRNSFERAWGTSRFLWPDLDRRGQVAHDNYYQWLNDRMTYEDVVKGFEWVPAASYKGKLLLETAQREGLTRPKYAKQIDGVLHYGQPETVKKYLNEAHPGRLVREAPCVLTHFRRAQCCAFHPKGFLPTAAPQVIKHTVNLVPAQKKAIRELEEHYMTWLDGQPLGVDLTMTQQQRIRQIALGVPTLEFYPSATDDDEKVRLRFEPDCKSPFTEWALDLLEELDDEPVVIFLESQAFAQVLVEKLKRAGISAFEYSGKTRDVRDDNLAEFGKKYRVAVVSILAGGTGLDGLQRVTKTEFWFERSVDESLNVQAEARADRIGGIGQVQRHYFQDELGYAEGRMSEQLEKRRALARTLVVR